MSYGLHINENPNGTYSFVGSVPLSVMEQRTPTPSDVMAGRTINGIAYYCKGYKTIDEILTVAKNANVQLCKNPNCACRKLF